ncbi:MAG: hypothetical protein K0M46_06685 [Thiobacillus sp.]|nr:hypothetical protein [Thiobacillus sp.]
MTTAQRIVVDPITRIEGHLRIEAETDASGKINAARTGAAVDPAVTYPTIDDGVRGVAFVEACVASSRKDGAWVKL